MEPLMTKKELAEHWKVSTKAIENWINAGILSPCKGVPGDIRFSPSYIAELEGVKLEKTSPLEHRRLEREYEEVKQERDYYKSIVAEMDLITSKVRLNQIEKGA